ncbi:type 1 glutamine amidotransferase [Acidovorax sp. Be4]|uniref:Type 1 glutamine amidotransferase n=1 Tax=Acidovorax bellezanensis TaxID=2976702 RepID=A0ABT2PJL5_9BURK|nr:type 1 glutamine amidotransferase [Acidovorax sp. Be4]MCT9810673.1 type 1 glutamine amidotransferase [Acidovorax sp. Be4]
MKPIAILQHEATQGPGVLREHLDSLDIPYQLFCPPLEGSAPRQAHDYSAVVSLGSNHCANERLAWIDAELALLRDAQQHDLPALGHCFGAQMLARAMDARVWRNTCANIGWSKVWVTQPAQQLMHLPGQTTIFHWHYDTFDIPRGAVRTMYGKHCLNKGFRRGRQWAFQGHLEVTPESVQAWCAAGHDELQCARGPAVQTEAQILSELSARAPELRATAYQVYGAWTDQIERPVMAVSAGWSA